MNPEKRREQIIAAATAVFAKKGYEGASMAAICRQAGITRPTLYQYFRDKESIFREIVTGYTGRIGAITKMMDFRSAGITPDELLYRKHLLLFKEIYENKDIIRMIMREHEARTPRFEALTSRFSNGFKKTIRTELELRTREGNMACGDTEFFASFVYGSVNMIIKDFILDARGKPDLEALARKVTDLHLAMFKSGLV